MSNLEQKIKIFLFPNFFFESVIATFLNKNRFEIVFGDSKYHELEAKYSSGLYGDWCYPLKFAAAICAEAVQKNHAQIIIGLNANICSYPLLMSGLKEWIKGDFEYYLISMNKLGLSRGFLYYYYIGLRRAIKINLFKYIFKVPLALYRLYLSERVYYFYLKNLPLTREPRAYKKLFYAYRQKFVLADGWHKSRVVFAEFKQHTSRMVSKNKPQGSLIVSGDFSVLLLEFLLFDLDVYLAERGVEVIQTFSALSSPLLRKYSLAAKNSQRLLSKHLSSQGSRTKVDQKHLIEIITLAQIIRGLEVKPDGIIFFKPVMCTPCENVSKVAKRENYFGLPAVEVTYDEHSGLNGVLTRLEAFLNLIYPPSF